MYQRKWGSALAVVAGGPAGLGGTAGLGQGGGGIHPGAKADLESFAALVGQRVDAALAAGDDLGFRGDVAALLELPQSRVESALGWRTAAVRGPLDRPGDVVAMRGTIMQHLEDEEAAKRHLDGACPIGAVGERRGGAGNGVKSGHFGHIERLCLRASSGERPSEVGEGAEVGEQHEGEHRPGVGAAVAD
jgi:hypothetical protein